MVLLLLMLMMMLMLLMLMRLAVQLMRRMPPNRQWRRAQRSRHARQPLRFVSQGASGVHRFCDCVYVVSG